MSLIQDRPELLSMLSGIVNSGKWEDGAAFFEKHLKRTPDGDIDPFKGEPLETAEVENLGTEKYEVDDPGLAVFFGSIHLWISREHLASKRGMLTKMVWLGTLHSLEIAEVFAMLADEVAIRIRYRDAVRTTPIMSERANDVSSGRFKLSATEKFYLLVDKVEKAEKEKKEREEREEGEEEEEEVDTTEPVEEVKSDYADIAPDEATGATSFDVPRWTLLLWGLRGEQIDDIPF